MDRTQSVADKVIARLRARREPTPTSALLDLGGRAAVDQSLSRLAGQGRIRRIRRGLYDLPRTGSLLNQPLMPSPDRLVRAWAKGNGLRVVPSGAHAANLLGLSTQVPARIVYYTNGRTQSVKLGPYTAHLLNRGPKTMDVSGRLSPLVRKRPANPPVRRVYQAVPLTTYPQRGGGQRYGEAAAASS